MFTTFQYYIIFRYFPDINECTANPYPCDANADCDDTDGSFNCTCRPGYTGNGIVCEGTK